MFVMMSLALAAEPLQASLFEAYVHDPAEAQRLLDYTHERAARAAGALATVGPADAIGDVVRDAVRDNLVQKLERAQAGDPVPLSPDEIRRTVIDFEATRVEQYVTSGVYPRKYFGYLDGKGLTAPDELRLRKAVSASVDVVNAWQVAHNGAVRVTDIEVATTFLSECGAVYMRDHRDQLDRLHPVFAVGLDDVASGFSALPGLEDDMDRALGTRLGGIVAWAKVGATELPVPSEVPNDIRWVRGPNGDAGPFPYLVRFMTLEEGVAATAMMYLWEKRLADGKLVKAGWGHVMDRDLDDQFIIGSLVYNSGNAHSPERWKAIRTFSTGEFLFKKSEDNANKRPRLPVLTPKATLARLARGEGMIDQPTSWLALYHILQRWGAFHALRTLTADFDAAGRLLPLVPPRAEDFPKVSAMPSSVAPAEPATGAPPGGCASAPAPALWVVGLVLATFRRRA